MDTFDLETSPVQVFCKAHLAEEDGMIREIAVLHANVLEVRSPHGGATTLAQVVVNLR